LEEGVGDVGDAVPSSSSPARSAFSVGAGGDEEGAYNDDYAGGGGGGGETMRRGSSAATGTSIATNASTDKSTDGANTVMRATLSPSKLMSLEEYNLAASRIYMETVRHECPQCHRKFNPEEQLLKHMWGCCPKLLKEREETQSAIEEEVYRRSRHPEGKLTTDHPIRVICHVCGKGAGTKSLVHHYAKCKVLFIAHQQKVPPSRRKSLPAPPDLPIPQQPGKELDAYNALALKIYRDSMYHCPTCAEGDRPKAFASEEKLWKHMSSCCASLLCVNHKVYQCESKLCQMHQTQRAEAASLAESGNFSRTLVVCHLCGRDVRAESLGYHFEKCVAAFNHAESAKPLKERRRLPAPPANMIPTRNGPELVRYNCAATQIFMNTVRIACERCGRRFFGTERLEKHLAGCTGPSPRSPTKRAVAK